MRNHIFTFQNDKPEVIRLKYPSGKPFRKGDYSGYTYTLANGLICFFPEEANKEIQALHLAAGEPFQITKRSMNGSGFAWDVERVAGGPDYPKPDRPPVDTEGIHNPPAQIAPDHSTNGHTLSTRESQVLYRQLVACIDAAKGAEAHAALIGFPLKFKPEDIRAMAISGFIQQAREGY